MSKWNVHYGCRLTYDIEVEADTKEKAIAKAERELNNITYNDFDFADDDMDVWEIKEI